MSYKDVLAEKTAEDTPEFLTKAELLQRLHIGQSVLARMMRQGIIPYVRPTGRRLIFHYPSVKTSLLRHQRGGDL